MVDLAGKRVMVTGGAGFIGSRLVDRLIEKGCEVVALDNFDDFYSGKERNVVRHIGKERFRLVGGDILNYELLLNAVRGVEVVFHGVYDIDEVCLRYFSVYSPRSRPDQVIYSAAYRMLTGSSPIVYGSGEQRRDFTYVSDVVEATLLAAETEGIGGEVFNIGFGRDSSINELLKILSDNMGINRVEPEYVDSCKGDFERTLADNSKARRMLGWKPMISLEEGVRRFVEWLGSTLTDSERVLKN